MRLHLILASYIIATLCGATAYSQSKKSNVKGKTTKSEVAASTTASSIEDVKKELAIYNLDKADELIDRIESANRRNKKRIRCLMALTQSRMKS